VERYAANKRKQQRQNAGGRRRKNSDDDIFGEDGIDIDTYEAVASTGAFRESRDEEDNDYN
jgi:hypothetical protein